MMPVSEEKRDIVRVVYSARTGRIRSFGDGDLLTGPGEKRMDLPSSSVDRMQEQVSAATGLVPSDDRYAVVDSDGKVVGAVLADLDCADSIEKHQLVPHPEASAGWTFDGEKFAAPVDASPAEVLKDNG